MPIGEFQVRFLLVQAFFAKIHVVPPNGTSVHVSTTLYGRRPAILALINFAGSQNIFLVATGCDDTFMN